MSGKGQLTRPMMERVRAATFDMLLSYSGSVARLPQGSRWLDLFAGTTLVRKGVLVCSSYAGS